VCEPASLRNATHFPPETALESERMNRSPDQLWTVMKIPDLGYGSGSSRPVTVQEGSRGEIIMNGDSKESVVISVEQDQDSLDL
jgi:hypothetical protein